LKIGIVSEYHYPSIGGIQDHVHFFHNELLRLGYETVVFTSGGAANDLPTQEAVPEVGRVIRFRKSRTFPANGSTSRLTTGIGLVRRFREAIQAERCDLLHVHTPFVPTLPMLALKEARVPVVGTFHTNFQENGDRFIKRFLPFMRLYVARLDARIAVSHTSASLMKKHFGGSYHIIPNGVDVAGFRTAAPFPHLRDGKLNLLFVGRLDPRNGLDDLLSALQLLDPQMPLRLLVMGDGPDRKRYEAEAASLGEGKVVFLGTCVRNKQRWYASADLLCAPMHVASFGMVLIEAMAAGLPIVANRIAGFTDVMQEGVHGLFTDTRDPHAFAAAIAKLAANELLRRRLGKAGTGAVERYSWQTVASQVLDVYREVLGLTAMLKPRRVL
jgi:phosphatidylinositol alpha-mannosyltransferase